MGRFDVSFDDDFIKALGSLAEVNRYAPKMIEEALPIVRDKLKSKIDHEGHVVYGDLIKSIKCSDIKETSTGYIGHAFPSGTNREGVRNAEALVYLEYGTSTQDATGIITRTLKSCEKEVRAKMQEVFEREALKGL